MPTQEALPSAGTILHEPFPMRVQELRFVPARELMRNPLNFRTHPPAQRSALTSMLKRIGIANAVLAYASPAAGGALTLIDGHLRTETAPDSIWPVLVLNLSDEEAPLLLASLDPIASMATHDPAILDALLAQLQTTGSDVLDSLLADLRGPTQPALAIDLPPARTTVAEASSMVQLSYTVTPAERTTIVEALRLACDAEGLPNAAAALVWLARTYLDENAGD